MSQSRPIALGPIRPDCPLIAIGRWVRWKLKSFHDRSILEGPAAKALIDRYGEDASIEASMRADEMLDKGDMEGKAMWLRILEAIKDLQNTVPTGAVH